MFRASHTRSVLRLRVSHSQSVIHLRVSDMHVRDTRVCTQKGGGVEGRTRVRASVRNRENEDLFTHKRDKFTH